MEQKILIACILFIVVVAVSYTLFPGQSIASVRKNLSGESNILVKSYNVKIDAHKEEGKNVYDITIGLSLEYKGKIGESIDVKPLIEFKDVESETQVRKNGEIGTDSLTLTEGKTASDIRLQTRIETAKPLIKQIQQGVISDDVKLYDSYHVESVSGGDFVVTIANLMRSKLNFLSERSKRPCYAYITVQCKDASDYTILKDCKYCSTKNGCCSDTMKMCEGSVEVSITDNSEKDNENENNKDEVYIDCDNNRIKAGGLKIIAKKGKDYDVKEKLHITFWKDTSDDFHCVRNWYDSRILLSQCASDFLGTAELDVDKKNINIINY